VTVSGTPTRHVGEVLEFSGTPTRHVGEVLELVGTPTSHARQVVRLAGARASVVALRVGADVPTDFLKEENHAVKGMPEVVGFGEADMEAMTAGLVKDPEKTVQVIPVHLHHPFAGRNALENVPYDIKKRHGPV
jgi:hypothetical protein